MKKGFDVFGKEYGVMFRIDLHAPGSVDVAFLKEMILLEEETKEFLYQTPLPVSNEMKAHELYIFAQRFQKEDTRETIAAVVAFLEKMANDFLMPFEEMEFGGREIDILKRGTDWCTDISRLGAVLLQCLAIPTRIVHVVNLQKAYHGHVLVEAYYEGCWGLVDFLHGFLFWSDGPVSARGIFERKCSPTSDLHMDEDYASLFEGIAIHDYDPWKKYDYTISKTNDYYRRLINASKDNWFMHEEDPLVQKMAIVLSLAKEFKCRNIRWAIGASFLLYQKGIVDDFHDLDILVDPEDVLKVFEILDTQGCKKVKEEDDKFASDVFETYCIGDFEIDVIVNFTCLKNGKRYCFPLQAKDIEMVEVDHVMLPLHSVSLWRMCYDVMNRKEKVSLIDRYLKELTI